MKTISRTASALALIAASAVWSETTPSAAAIIFDKPLTEETPETLQCVATRAIRSIAIVSEELVVVHGSHNRHWINRLLHKCAGLNDDMVLKLEPWGARVCKNSRFEARDRFYDAPFTVSCRWGGFEPAAPEQVAMIKSELGEL